jgi:arginine/ornithine N-succinyltransferase beta subunit
MAKLTGGGFTNLPADRATLEAKLARSEAGFARKGENSQADDLYVFVLEDFEDRRDPRHLPGVRRRSASSSPSTAI